MSIVIKSEACYGCRMCELICSFHHTGAFAPEASSIKIFNRFRTGEISQSIDSTCDSCQGETQPLCVKYCVYGALKEG